MDGPFYLHETVQAEAGTTIAYTLQDSAPRVLLRITATCTAIRREVQRQQRAQAAAHDRTNKRFFEIITGNSFQDKQY